MSIIFQVQKTLHNWITHDSTTNVKGGAFKQWFIQNLNLQLKIDKVEIYLFFMNLCSFQKMIYSIDGKGLQSNCKLTNCYLYLSKSIFYDYRQYVLININVASISWINNVLTYNEYKLHFSTKHKFIMSNLSWCFKFQFDIFFIN
jgi:hypothetical protein